MRAGLRGCCEGLRKTLENQAQALSGWEVRRAGMKSEPLEPFGRRIGEWGSSLARASVGAGETGDLVPGSLTLWHRGW